MAISIRKPHILIFPYPAQGHMIPLLDLTHHLAMKNNLTITILITPKNLPLLNPLLSSHAPATIQPLVLPFPPHPSLPAGVENAKDLPTNLAFTAMAKALADLHNPIVDWFKSHPSPPVAIISDFFLGWTENLAREVGVKRIVFSPSGAFALSLVISLWKDLPRPDVNGTEQNGIVPFIGVPNSPEFRWDQISTMYRRYLAGDPNGEFLKNGFRLNIESWGLIINTFRDLESVYLDHLIELFGQNRVWAVGPTLPDSNSQNRGGSSSSPVTDVINWLDGREVNSVVYVCFGSLMVLTNEQMEALASSLEKSGVYFVWSVKQPSKEHVECRRGMVPLGFEDRVAGRGLVIKGWAPQVEILGHPAVGTFLTHCGWNSVLEGLVIGGALLLTWPMGADQFTNAKLLVDDLRVGVRACEGVSTVPDSDELAKVMAEAASENRVERERAVEMRNAAMEAVKENGSSGKDLEALVKHLRGLQV
jgi:hypothetical protein